MPLIRYISLFLCLFSFVFAAYACADGRTIDLQTSPALDQVRPLSDPVRIVLRVLDSDKKPAEGMLFKIRIYAPTAGWLFSTDFPLVEGSRLIEMDLPAFHGSVDWEYVFPIRGIYRMEVTAIDERREEVKKVFNLAVRENRLKFVYLGCLAIVLFLFGVMAGRLFSAQDKS